MNHEKIAVRMFIKCKLGLWPDTVIIARGYVIVINMAACLILASHVLFQISHVHMI